MEKELCDIKADEIVTAKLGRGYRTIEFNRAPDIDGCSCAFYYITMMRKDDNFKNSARVYIGVFNIDKLTGEIDSQQSIETSLDHLQQICTEAKAMMEGR